MKMFASKVKIETVEEILNFGVSLRFVLVSILLKTFGGIVNLKTSISGQISKMGLTRSGIRKSKKSLREREKEKIANHFIICTSVCIFIS